VVHGSGGGHDQGMAFAGSLADQGIRVIAMSRFGYLRTPMPADASAAAQADAHVCLLDALGIRRPPSWAARPVRLRRCRWPSATRIGSAR
jgi:2-hydroxy-6-oxonona-2,4-dienedioate hydrolase